MQLSTEADKLTATEFNFYILHNRKDSPKLCLSTMSKPLGDTIPPAYSQLLGKSAKRFVVQNIREHNIARC